MRPMLLNPIPCYLQCLLVVLLVLTVFSPTIFAEFSNIDDLEMINCMRQADNFSIVSAFLPKGSGGLYYRPIIHLSYLFDRFSFGLSAPWMHLHNILIHLANALLVLFIARRAVVPELAKTSLMPLAASLLFGLHPLATESVNWVSGRTDLLSGFFLLLATLCLLSYRCTNSRLNGYGAMLFMALAVLTKEFALAFLPGAAFILIASKLGGGDELESKGNSYRTVLYVVLILAAVVVLFFLLRMVAFSSNSSRIMMTIRFLLTDPVHTAKVFMGAFAFYLKKIFFPWPLNFAIVEIDPLYELLAIPLLAICMMMLIRRDMPSALFITGILLFSPAFVIAFNQIAWTPYAERYAYLSTAYVVVGCAWFIVRKLKGQLKKFVVPAGVLLICLAGGTTLARNFTWQTNLSLLRDTAEKSPEMSDIRLLYGALLAERGSHDEALVQLEQGKRLPTLGYDERFDLNIAAILLARHQTEKAIALLEESVRRSKGRSERPIRELLVLLERKLARAGDVKEREVLGRHIIQLRKDLYRITNDASQFTAMHETACKIGDMELQRRFSSLKGKTIQ